MLANINKMPAFKRSSGGWRGDSVVKSTSRSLEFSFQQPHDSSQPSILGSEALFGHAGETFNISDYSFFEYL